MVSKCCSLAVERICELFTGSTLFHSRNFVKCDYYINWKAIFHTHVKIILQSMYFICFLSHLLLSFIPTTCYFTNIFDAAPKYSCKKMLQLFRYPYSTHPHFNSNLRIDTVSGGRRDLASRTQLAEFRHSQELARATWHILGCILINRQLAATRTRNFRDIIILLKRRNVKWICSKNDLVNTGLSLKVIMRLTAFRYFKLVCRMILYDSCMFNQA